MDGHPGEPVGKLNMKMLEEYITLAAQFHGHMCPGQVLGIRMAMLGLQALGVDDLARFRKRLVTYVEIDRCATDAVSLVTGCRLGKRSLKFRDFGKVAATFVDIETGRAVRVVARDDAREKARSLFPGEADPHQAQLEAYQRLPDADLFVVKKVRAKILPQELPGRPRARVTCQQCGESISDGREIVMNGRTLCRCCGGEAYYEIEEG